MSKPFRLPFYKRIFTHPHVQNAATRVIAGFMKCCWPTYRIHLNVPPAAERYLRGEENAIFCFWHGRMLIFPHVKPRVRPMHVLISFHRDGELIAKVIGHFGIHTVRGSSSRGARAATRELLSLLARGDNVSITPDGPRGPRHHAQKGAAMLAALSGRPLLPVSFAASPSRRLSSWDKFLIPLPFARIVIEMGEPLFAHGQESEGLRQVLERQLNELTERAERAI